MFEVIKQEGKARRGVFTCAHGTVQTPVFMNVGTVAAIKGAVSTEDLEGIGRMASEFQERKAKEKAEKEKSEQEKLLELLQKADRNTAVKAAAEFMTIAGAE